MGAVKTFWLEPTGRVLRRFRCYQDGCPNGSYCNAYLPLDEVPETRDEFGQSLGPL